LKRAALVVAIAVAAAGCGGSAESDIERAIESGRVAGAGDLTATNADCDEGLPMSSGRREGRLHECTADTRDGIVPLSCGMFEGDDQAYCAVQGEPPGEPVFTTAAERAAPKVVTWKCEDEDDEGRQIGPAFVSIEDGGPGSPVEEHEWMTQADARRLARRLGADFGIDC
jgi:hypothetical protein